MNKSSQMWLLKDILNHKTTDYVEYVQLHVFYTILNIFYILCIILSTFMYKIPNFTNMYKC